MRPLQAATKQSLHWPGARFLLILASPPAGSGRARSGAAATPDPVHGNAVLPRRFSCARLAHDSHPHTPCTKVSASCQTSQQMINSSFFIQRLPLNSDARPCSGLSLWRGRTSTRPRRRQYEPPPQRPALLPPHEPHTLGVAAVQAPVSPTQSTTCPTEHDLAQRRLRRELPERSSRVRWKWLVGSSQPQATPGWSSPSARASTLARADIVSAGFDPRSSARGSSPAARSLIFCHPGRPRS